MNTIHDEVGYNYRLVNVLAAIGVGQMEQLPSFIKRKKEVDAFYKKALTGVGDIRFQKELPDVETNGWFFTIQTDKQKEMVKTPQRKQHSIPPLLDADEPTPYVQRWPVHPPR